MTDAWRPSADVAGQRAYAACLSTLRDFFAARDVLEVHTPVFSRSAAPDVHLASATAQLGGVAGFLHTSPEYFMKRLLASGCPDCYQICKVFRGGESGRLHNPEFTLLEWYRLGWNYRRLADETAELIKTVLAQPQLPVETQTFADAFRSSVGLDPLHADRQALMEVAETLNISADSLSNGELMDAIAGLKVYPELGQAGLSVVIDFPVSMAALSRIRNDTPPVAERFEVFYRGVELANGFGELTDADEQRRRFEEDNRQRQASGKPVMPLDEALLAALQHGLPDSAGVALGVDRLVMFASGSDSLQEVLGFPFDRV